MMSSYGPGIAAEEVGAVAPLRLGQGHAGQAPRLLALQEVGHVPGKVPHGLEPLGVLRRLPRLGAVHEVPIGGSHHGHAGDAEILVEHVEAGRGAAPPGHGHRRPGLEGEGPAAAVEDPVQEAEDAAGGMGVVDRGTEDEAVRRLGLGDEVVDPVVRPEGAARRGALAAAQAIPEGAVAHVHDLIVDPLPLQLFADLPEGHIGVARGPGAAVEHQYFHRIPPCMIMRLCCIYSLRQALWPPIWAFLSLVVAPSFRSMPFRMALPPNFLRMSSTACWACRSRCSWFRRA